jgi:hypothetical protein
MPTTMGHPVMDNALSHSTGNQQATKLDTTLQVVTTSENINCSKVSDWFAVNCAKSGSKQFSYSEFLRNIKGQSKETDENVPPILRSKNPRFNASEMRFLALKINHIPTKRRRR